jgi:hypothetical protein
MSTTDAFDIGRIFFMNIDDYLRSNLTTLTCDDAPRVYAGFTALPGTPPSVRPLWDGAPTGGQDRKMGAPSYGLK